MNRTIAKIIAAREASHWRGRSRRNTPSNFTAEIGMLRAFMGSYPVDSEGARKAFFSSMYHEMALRVAPGNKAGQSLVNELNSYRP